MDHRPPPPQHPRNDFFWQDGPHHGHDGWWGGPLHVLFLILFVALAVVAAVWLVRRLTPGVAQATTPAVAPAGAVAVSGAPFAGDPAVATLRMRYAKGEVSREDFQNAIQDLTGAAPAESWPGTSPPEDAPTES